ncbi:hypothetical protein QPX96_02630 [Limosilactobacillus fermentum]|nr:hypothetical protein [Limosilactobacillus fermentum]
MLKAMLNFGKAMLRDVSENIPTKAPRSIETMASLGAEPGLLRWYVDGLVPFELFP